MKKLKVWDIIGFRYTKVDDDVYEWAKKLYLYLDKRGYVYFRQQVEGKQKRTRLHRLIMGAKDPNILIDHKDLDTLNNQRENLRYATHAENLRNQRKNKNNTSGYKGVFWDKSTNSWHVKIGFDNRYIYIGRFNNKIDGVRAYNEAAIKYHGEFARLNELP